MNFQVPQFIEIEDKIFGPLTIKQFLYIVGGVGLAFILYVYLPIYIAIIPMFVILGVAGMLAFFKYNERPFINLMESAFRFGLTSKLYVWRKSRKKVEIKASDLTAVKEAPKTPKLSDSRLKDLSWSLDVKDIIR